MARWQPRMWVVGAVLLGIRLCAQEVEQEPLPVSWSYRSESFPIVAREQVATIVLPVPNVDSVLAEERRLDSLGVIRPYRFGIAIPVEVDVKEQGTVELLEDGRYLIRLRFVCPGAKTLNVGVKRYRFAEGTQLFVYGTFPYRPGYRSFAVDGPFPRYPSWRVEQFWTWPVVGEQIWIECVVPTEGMDELVLELDYVVYGFQPVEPLPEEGKKEQPSEQAVRREAEWTVRLIPQPAAEVVRIEVSGAEFERAEIYTVMGERIAELSNGVRVLNLRSYAPGTYVARVWTSRGMVSKVFLVMR